MSRWGILLAFALGCGSAARPLAEPQVLGIDSNVRIVTIHAQQFAYTPAVIHAQLDRPLVLELRSLDRVHGFNLPDFGVRTDIEPGRTTRVRIVPNKRGTFTFRCDVFCGDGHEGMSGQLVVE